MIVIPNIRQAPTSTYNMFEGIMARSIALVDPAKSRALWLARAIAPALSELQLNSPRQVWKKTVHS